MFYKFSKLGPTIHFKSFSAKISKFSDPAYAQVDGPKIIILFFPCTSVCWAVGPVTSKVEVGGSNFLFRILVALRFLDVI